MKSISWPLIIAHRGGRKEWPENTLEAFQQVAKITDYIELDVQVTKDGIPVVFHGQDLSSSTNGSGKIKNCSVNQLNTLDAGYQFTINGKKYPWRGKGLQIPTLQSVLGNPDLKKIKFIIDMKSLPAKDLVNALVKAIPDKEYERLIFYSTEDEHIIQLKKAKPSVRIFESRQSTRTWLLRYNNDNISNYLFQNLIGFEARRKMKVTEKYSLGKSSSDIDFKMWSKENIQAIRRYNPNVFIVVFGVNTIADYEQARWIGANAVYTDIPQKLNAYKKRYQYKKVDHLLGNTPCALFRHFSSKSFSNQSIHNKASSFFFCKL